MLCAMNAPDFKKGTGTLTSNCEPRSAVLWNTTLTTARSVSANGTLRIRTGRVFSTASPVTAAYVALLYFIVQWIGNHIATPLLQQRTLALPPALSLGLVALLGALFGFPGILLSGPLSVVVLVSVKMLYMEDVLERGQRNNALRERAWTGKTNDHR